MIETYVATRRLAPAALRMLVANLRAGATVVFPTETSYGLGCDALNRDAVRRVFAIKGRTTTKALPVLFGDLATLKRFVHWTPVAARLARRYWPGALTLVLRARGIPRLVTGGRASVAVRLTSHPIAQQIAHALRGPLVATSANRSTRPARYHCEHIEREFRQHIPDVVIDAGHLPRRVPSTIVDVTGPSPRVLRQGGVRVPGVHLIRPR